MQKYLPLKNETAKIGDEYYKCLSETLTKPHSKSKIDDCLRIALNYQSALRAQMKDLSRLSDVRFVRRERELITKYLDLIEHDLSSLTQGEIDDLLRNRRPNFDQ